MCDRANYAQPENSSPQNNRDVRPRRVARLSPAAGCYGNSSEATAAKRRKQRSDEKNVLQSDGNRPTVESLMQIPEMFLDVFGKSGRGILNLLGIGVCGKVGDNVFFLSDCFLSMSRGTLREITR